MAEMKSSGEAAAMSTTTAVAVLLIFSLAMDLAHGQAVVTTDENKMRVTVNTNMTVNVHAHVPGSDTPFKATVYPGSTTLSISVPPGTDLTTLSFPMQISVDPVEILGIPVTAAANSTVMVAANSIVEIQGYLTQIMNAILGLITVYFKMIISSVPSMLPGVPPVTVSIPSVPVPAVPGVPPVAPCMNLPSLHFIHHFERKEKGLQPPAFISLIYFVLTLARKVLCESDITSVCRCTHSLSNSELETRQSTHQ